jgi:uncharacterized protein (TIGR03000 family)
VFIGVGGGWWWPGAFGFDGFSGGIAAAPYYFYDNYQSFYPPGDVYGSPVPGMVVPPEEAAPSPKAATAMVGVLVPTNDTELWFNGAKTQTRGTKREFVTPELPPGQTFSYEVKARWTAEGKEIERTRIVRVQAGMQSVVNFLVDEREQLPAPGLPQGIKME